MAIKLPTIAPKVNLPAAPKSSMTAFGTYPAGTMIGQLPPLKPMPQSVANNINLGWNYATGQVVQPLTAAQKAAVAIPPIGNLGIKIPTQTVYPTPAPAPNKTNLVNTIMNVASAPVKPQPIMPTAQATQMQPFAQSLPGKQALASTQQNMLINQFLPKPVASVRAPVAPKPAVPIGRY